MSNGIKNQWLAERAREVRASITELRNKVGPLTYLQLGWHAPEGGWSVAQVLEHLIITDQSYIEEFNRVLARAAQTPASEEWRPSLIGGFLIRSQRPESTMKVRTPRRWRPGPEPRAGVLEEYIIVREQLIQLMKRADGKDLRRTKLSSPAAKWIRINLGDAFMTLVVHTQRHLRQIDRITKHPDFPKTD
jgi:hypothetical protein